MTAPLPGTQDDGSPDTGDLYAWLARDAAGFEGIIAAPVGGMIMPLIAADLERARTLANHARAAARMRDSGPAKLVRFTRAETVLEAGS